MCSQWLHFLRIRPQRRKAPHVEEVAAREAAGAAGVGAEILADPTDDVVAPAQGLLPVKDLAPDRPVEEHQLRVDRSCGAALRSANPVGQRPDQFAVGLRSGDLGGRDAGGNVGHVATVTKRADDRKAIQALGVLSAWIGTNRPQSVGIP